MSLRHELLLADGRIVWAAGETALEAATDYANAHPGDVVVATRRFRQTNCIAFGPPDSRGFAAMGLSLLGSGHDGRPRHRKGVSS